MNGEAIQELASRLQKPQEHGEFICVPPGWMAVDPAGLVKAGPRAETLGVYTLGALRDYVILNRDRLDLATLVVHVVGPQLVTLSSRLDDRSRTRETYVHAQAHSLTDGFLGKYQAIEEFIVGLQSRFVESDARAQVLRLFGTVKQGAERTAIDDGITQTVTAKAGAVLASEVAVPNPVTLSPWRTFREVTQPQSAFVLRVQGGSAHAMPSVGLFEADGGAWRLVAIDRVCDWLTEALPKGIAILA